MSLIKKENHNGWLMSGAGNTFAMEITTPDKILTPDQAIAICRKNNVDGYLGLTQEGDNQFQWNFFNSDGSAAEFCGNAARCAQEFIFQNTKTEKSVHKTKAGVVNTWTENSKAWVKMPEPKVLDPKKEVHLEKKSYTGFWCDTGVPHFVINTANAGKTISKALRSHPDFTARGTNVTWVQEKNEIIYAVTYERGVEDFTQACGTGAMAASLWGQYKNSEQNNFQIQMPGGLLFINLKESEWVMTGPTKKIGDWKIE